MRDVTNLIYYTIHQACYKSIELSGKEILHSKEFPKADIISAFIGLTLNRKLIPSVPLEVFSVIQIKNDISIVVYGAIIANSYQCFAGEKTVLLEQSFTNLEYRIPFARARIQCK